MTPQQITRARGLYGVAVVVTGPDGGAVMTEFDATPEGLQVAYSRAAWLNQRRVSEAKTAAEAERRAA